jgi:hypothetical protein
LVVAATVVAATVPLNLPLELFAPDNGAALGATVELVAVDEFVGNGLTLRVVDKRSRSGFAPGAGGCRVVRIVVTGRSNQ